MRIKARFDNEVNQAFIGKWEPTDIQLTRKCFLTISLPTRYSGYRISLNRFSILGGAKEIKHAFVDNKRQLLLCIENW